MLAKYSSYLSSIPKGTSLEEYYKPNPDSPESYEKMKGYVRSIIPPSISPDPQYTEEEHTGTIPLPKDGVLLKYEAYTNPRLSLYILEMEENPYFHNISRHIYENIMYDTPIPEEINMDSEEDKQSNYYTEIVKYAKMQLGGLVHEFLVGNELDHPIFVKHYSYTERFLPATIERLTDLTKPYDCIQAALLPHKEHLCADACYDDKKYAIKDCIKDTQGTARILVSEYVEGKDVQPDEDSLLRLYSILLLSLEEVYNKYGFVHGNLKDNIKFIDKPCILYGISCKYTPKIFNYKASSIVVGGVRYDPPGGQQGSFIKDVKSLLSGKSKVHRFFQAMVGKNKSIMEELRYYISKVNPIQENLDTPSCPPPSYTTRVLKKGKTFFSAERKEGQYLFPCTKDLVRKCRYFSRRKMYRLKEPVPISGSIYVASPSKVDVVVSYFDYFCIGKLIRTFAYATGELYRGVIVQICKHIFALEEKYRKKTDTIDREELYDYILTVLSSSTIQKDKLAYALLQIGASDTYNNPLWIWSGDRTPFPFELPLYEFIDLLGSTFYKVNGIEDHPVPFL